MLTPCNSSAYTSGALAKAGAGPSIPRVEIPSSERNGAHQKRLFLRLKFMADDMGALLSAAPRSGHARPVSSATLLTSINGGSSLNLSEGTTMSAFSAPKFQEAINKFIDLDQPGQETIMLFMRFLNSGHTPSRSAELSISENVFLSDSDRRGMLEMLDKYQGADHVKN